MRVILAAAIFVLMFGALAACGDDDNGDDDQGADEPAAEETATPEPEPDPTATPTEAEEPAAAASPSPEAEPSPTPEAEPTATPEAMDETPMPEGDDEATEHVVEMLDPYEFSPQDITISAGDTITWVNASSMVHTATGDPELARDPENAILPEGAEPWDSGNLDPGEEFSYTFDVPGDYTYFCIPHEALDMVGSITVEE